MALIFFAVRVSIFKQTEITRAITKLMFAIGITILVSMHDSKRKQR